MCLTFMLCVVLFVRPPGSREVYYTETDDSVADSVTTMESTHTGRSRSHNRTKPRHDASQSYSLACYTDITYSNFSSEKYSCMLYLRLYSVEIL